MKGPNLTLSQDHAQLRHFPLPTLLVLIVGFDYTPQPIPIFSTCPQPPPKIFCPIIDANLIVEG